MFNLFKIDRYFKSASEITPEILREDNVLGIISDLDNTLVMHNQMEQTQQFNNFVKMLKEMGIGLVLLSNNNEPRVKDFLRELDIPYIAQANKPLLTGYSKALQILNVKKENAIMIGDQVFTDLWGANRSGIRCYLIDPIDASTDSFSIAVKRKFERFFVRLPEGNGK